MFVYFTIYILPILIKFRFKVNFLAFTRFESKIYINVLNLMCNAERIRPDVGAAYAEAVGLLTVVRGQASPLGKGRRVPPEDTPEGVYGREGE